MRTSAQRDTGSLHTLALEGAIRRIAQVVKDKEEAIALSMIAFLSRGHLLVEDVPGVGKTTLARALAKVVGGTFHRIQLTADLLPADLLGGQILDRERGGLTLRKGPIFANVVLADELNRATPRTQSGLLEAMAERSVSIDGESHPLPEPFLVIATQNPSEHHGVYPIPESQLDRFLVRTSLGYPGAAVEKALLLGGGVTAADPVEALQPVLNPELIASLFASVDRVQLGEDVVDYLHAIVRATREHRALETGVSTRGTISYARAVRARALVLGRDFVTPDDVRALAVPVCAHRVVVRGARRANRLEAESLVEEIVSKIPVPV